MELNELLMLSAAPIYATLLADMAAEKRARDQPGMPGLEWQQAAMRLAIGQARLMWHVLVTEKPGE